MRIGLPKRRKRAPTPPPAPPAADPEAELLAAARACDDALAALSIALAARRSALVRLTARTGLLGKGLVTRLFSPSAVWASFAHHGAGEAAGLPHVMQGHKRSFVASAQAVIEATAAYRRPHTAPAVITGFTEKELTHAPAD